MDVYSNGDGSEDTVLIWRRQTQEDILHHPTSMQFKDRQNYSPENQGTGYLQGEECWRGRGTMEQSGVGHSYIYENSLSLTFKRCMLYISYATTLFFLKNQTCDVNLLAVWILPKWKEINWFYGEPAKC